MKTALLIIILSFQFFKAYSVIYKEKRQEYFMKNHEYLITNDCNCEPGITITASQTTICPGQTIAFTASILNGGSLPHVQWKRNGINIGADMLTFTSAELNNGDIISAELVSNADCATSPPVISNSIVIYINPVITPYITVNTLPQPCTASKYTFTVKNGVAPEDMATDAITLAGPGNDDYTSGLTPFPFTFIFSGVAFNTFAITTNGSMALGYIPVVDSYYGLNIISPGGYDLFTGNNGSVKYKVTGVAGARKLIVEWKERACCVNSTFDRTFQVWLFEGSNIIQFIYGSVSGGGKIGISTSITDFLYVNSTNNTAGSATHNFTNLPPSGSSYIFTPCPSDHIRSASVCSGNNLSLNTNAIGNKQWFLNNLPLQEAVNSSLTVNAAGDYKVRVTNGQGCSALSDSTQIISLQTAGNVSFSADVSGSLFQWQMSRDDNVYTDISDDLNYNGANTALLTLINVPSSFSGNKYRCVTDSTPGKEYIFRYTAYWIGSADTIWENSLNWGCNLLPDTNTDVIINSGTIKISTYALCRSLVLSPTVKLTLIPGAKLDISGH